MINFDLLRRLIQEVETSGIDTLEISRWGTKIRITKSPGGAVPGAPGTLTIPVGSNVPPPASAHAGNANQAATPPTVEPAPAETKPKESLHEVTSPMVGTLYRAPAPDAPPYVEVGQHVSKGQTLCILEAMKLMNELQSEVDGVIRDIPVKNAEPVEYGQVLFRVALT
jgi:acetyl-CoA carboxylase biotin carboxyl carrier protein